MTVRKKEANKQASPERKGKKDRKNQYRNAIKFI